MHLSFSEPTKVGHLELPLLQYLLGVVPWKRSANFHILCYIPVRLSVALNLWDQSGNSVFPELINTYNYTSYLRAFESSSPWILLLFEKISVRWLDLIARRRHMVIVLEAIFLQVPCDNLRSCIFCQVKLYHVHSRAFSCLFPEDAFPAQFLSGVGKTKPP